MKKTISILLILLLSVSLFAACGKGQTTDEQPSSSPNEGPSSSLSQEEPSPAPSGEDSSKADPSMPLPADDRLSVKKEDGALVVSVTSKEDAQKEVSLIVLTDLSYQYSWMDHTEECLSDLGQLRLDDQGCGKLTLTIKKEGTPLFLVLTAPSGSYSIQIN